MAFSKLTRIVKGDDREDIEKWIDIELEHTNSRKEAKKIVLDHIREHGLGYYPALIKMEKELSGKG